MSMLSDIDAYCKKNNVRYFGKRIIVISHLLSLDGDIDGDILWRSLKKNNINISVATVYNTLNWLTQSGFIEKKSLSSRKNVFSLKLTE